MPRAGATFLDRAFAVQNRARRIGREPVPWMRMIRRRNRNGVA